MRRNSRQAAERPPRRKTVFLAALVDTVNVTLTCRRADIPRRTAYDWREADEGFARKWDDAVDEGIDLLEAELHKRAFEGESVRCTTRGNKWARGGSIRTPWPCSC